jgi:preprotein translocase subunit SecA
MFSGLLTKVFGTKHEREIKKLQPVVVKINNIEKDISVLSDSELQAKTPEFKERILKGESLDDILPEAFAVVREASKRTIGLRHYDVQLIGGIVLHNGIIAEMRTGEGKTLVATLPVYLNSLEGKGVHVVTVNDYLAKRDSNWMGQIYRFLGLEVGVIVHGMDDDERKKAYNADVTYGTNNEFGFDYLKDNMKFSLEEMVQREFNYSIVDEVDSILIDEARTPLIISGPSEKSTDLYVNIDRIIPYLKKDTDFILDEKANTVTLNEEGVQKCEKLLGISNLYDPANVEILHHVQQGLKAHSMFQRDVDYIVKEDQVIIVDEFTGRLMPGRRYSDGLHQALEAKEKVRVQSENQTLASITFQNYFRMYKKLSGMTGTAETEAAEFHKIYNLDVVIIPTHNPMVRIDNADVVYKTQKEKFNAVVQDIRELYNIGRPVLVGTTSVEKSELISSMLKKYNVTHQVLNAKYHEKEAEIVSLAGQKAAITIATNMAGRGTDIVLGEGVKELGGLHIIGTERHESRRIDNQLRGRSGRQGDSGSSRFYLALEDDLLRIFGSDKIAGIMEKMGMEEGEPIEHPMLSRAIENAQKRVEGHNFEIRKHLLDYDDVMNKQREVIYGQRRLILKGDGLFEEISDYIDDMIEILTETYCNVGEDAKSGDWDWKNLEERLAGEFNINPELLPKQRDEVTINELKDKLKALFIQKYEEQKAMFGEEMVAVERYMALQTLDNLWKEHLLNMDHLREGIGLRGYGQKDPLLEYKKDGYNMFMSMLSTFKEDILSILLRIRPVQPEQIEKMQEEKKKEVENLTASHGNEPKEEQKPKQQPVKRDTLKVGRNDSCPCGSGKKFKKCCGIKKK